MGLWTLVGTGQLKYLKYRLQKYLATILLDLFEVEHISASLPKPVQKVLCKLALTDG